MTTWTFHDMPLVETSEAQRALIADLIVQGSETGREYFAGRPVTSVRLEEKQTGPWLYVEFDTPEHWSYIPPTAPESEAIRRVLRP